MKERFQWDVRPVAASGNQVIGAHYRFTVLTPQLIRMEFSRDGVFEDRASQSVFYRDFPLCTYTVQRASGVLTLETGQLTLQYREEEPFSADSLQLTLKTEPGSRWCFGQPFETLGGTAKTLDEFDGRCPLGDGVCSRNGFSVIDDTNTLALEEDGWIGVRAEGNTDHYFFGYGLDYRGAVKALYQLTGAPPLLPAYALGNWWSRYYVYTQQEYLELMDRFRREDIPFSVSVIDMDWHITKLPEGQQEEKLEADSWYQGGWTGYSWNKELFPDHKDFLRQLHARNLKTALNLHPAMGTRCHEDMYEEMAKANGIDPATKQRVPLDLLSRKHMETYFDILHHPYERDGVDFWWMDWQQGTNYWWIHAPNAPGTYQDPRERMDPLWMLNHLHIMDISRRGKRPMFFSRYSGPGSHRYPVGFSGDVVISWDSLRFQPEFTATASNVGYSWWSHDIGGHMWGIHDDALYIRWLQFGVFSPINRLHSTLGRFIYKEPWKYPREIAGIAGTWLRLRHKLLPYLYTMNERNHRELLPLVQPMYYSHPRCHEAYCVPNQFWFGSDLMVSPITQPNDPAARLGETEVWLPDGDWFDWFSGLHYQGLGGRRMKVFRTLEQMPVFARAGAITPLACREKGDNRLVNPEKLEVLVFPGADGSFVLYEDAGEGEEYQKGAFSTTAMELRWGETAEFVIHPVRGDRSLIPGHRVWRIGFRGFHRDACVPGGQWEAETNTWWVTAEADTDEKIAVHISGEQLVHDNSDVFDRCEEILRFSQIPHEDKSMIMKMLLTESNQKPERLRTHAARVSGTSSPVARALVELLTLTDMPKPRN